MPVYWVSAVVLVAGGLQACPMPNNAISEMDLLRDAAEPISEAGVASGIRAKHCTAVRKTHYEK